MSDTQQEQNNAKQPGCAQTQVIVKKADLPLSCPMPSMSLWNTHPRVYLSIEEAGGELNCPYCGTHYILESDTD